MAGCIQHSRHLNGSNRPHPGPPPFGKAQGMLEGEGDNKYEDKKCLKNTPCRQRIAGVASTFYTYLSDKIIRPDRSIIFDR